MRRRIPETSNRQTSATPDALRVQPGCHSGHGRGTVKVMVCIDEETASLQMDDLHITPVLLKIFGYQTPMAVMRLFFAAQEAAFGNDLTGKCLFNAPFL